MKPSLLRNLFAYAVESMYLTYGTMYSSDKDKETLVRMAKTLRDNSPIKIKGSIVDGRAMLPIVCDVFAMFYNRTFMSRPIDGWDYDRMFNTIFIKEID